MDYGAVDMNWEDGRQFVDLQAVRSPSLEAVIEKDVDECKSEFDPAEKPTWLKEPEVLQPEWDKEAAMAVDEQRRSTRRAIPRIKPQIDVVETEPTKSTAKKGRKPAISKTSSHNYSPVDAKTKNTAKYKQRRENNKTAVRLNRLKKKEADQERERKLADLEIELGLERRRHAEQMAALQHDVDYYKTRAEDLFKELQVQKQLQNFEANL